MSPKQSYRPADEPARLAGQVIKWMPDKGFGFIQAEGREYFFHRSAVREGVDSLQIGQSVTFVQQSSPKGPRAEDVELV